MNSITAYREFCKEEKGIHVFSQDWWLDSVCGENNWDVILVKKNNEIMASFPYYRTVRKGMSFLEMPKLTQALGPYIRYPKNLKQCKKIGYEKKIMNEIIRQLPEFSSFKQSFHYKITNWLPFFWDGYKQTTRYTYVIEGIRNSDEVLNNFDRSKKKNIKKAEGIVEIKYDLSTTDFYENHQYTLAKQGAVISYEFQIFKNLYENSYKRGQGRTLYAIDEEGNIHGALFIVWDSESAYDLISTIDPDFRNSGAASLLVYKAIELVKDKVNIFDFEGSMIESVENSFRLFGAFQKPYFHISKTNSTLIKIRDFFRGIKR